MNIGARCLIAVLVALVARGATSYACTNSCAVTAQTRLIRAGNASSILGFHGDHAWADAWRTGHWDVVNNYGGGNTSCASTSGSSGCSSHYSAWYQAWGGSNCTSYDYMSCQYKWADNLTYGVTGVCPQRPRHLGRHGQAVPEPDLQDVRRPLARRAGRRHRADRPPVAAATTRARPPLPR